LNIVLLARDLLEGHANPVSAAVVVASTAAYALLALALAARLFGAEAVLYTETGGWGRLWRRRRTSPLSRGERGRE
jgi:ABC-2 type transport system permease protein/sodium transport system permease protein